MSNEEVRQTHAALIELHKKIRGQFAGLDEEVLRRIYPQHHNEVIEHGDGYTLRSVPNCVDELMDLMVETELVLIVAKFPLLDEKSEFDAHKNLAEIPYWRCKVKLRMEVGRSRKFHFWVWQNDFPVHGKNISAARDNSGRLLGHSSQLREMLEKQRRVSGRLVTTCKDWLHDHDRKLKVFEHTNLENEVDRVLERLKKDRSVSYKHTNVFGADNIMKLLTNQG